MSSESHLAQQDDGEFLNISSAIGYARIIWRRRSLVVLGLVVALVLGSLYYVQKKPVYESSAEVLVVNKNSDAVTGDTSSQTHFEDYIATHTVLIRSPLVVEKAVQEGQLRALETFSGEQYLDKQAVVEAVIQQLTISRGSKKDLGTRANNVLRIAFRGTVAEECSVVVNAVLESYKSFLDETYRNMTDDTLTLITQARDVLDNDLSKVEKEYAQFRAESPLLWNGQQQINPLLDRLIAIASQKSALLLRRVELQNQLSTIERAVEKGTSHDDLVAMITDLSSRSLAANTNPQTGIEQQMLPLLLMERRLLENYGPNHPHVVSIQERIKATRNFFALPSAAFSLGTDTGAEEGDFVQMRIKHLHGEIAQLEASEHVLDELFEAEQQATRELAAAAVEEDQFRSAVARTQKLYDITVERLQEANLVKDYGGFDARVIAPAIEGEKVAPSIIKIGLASIMVGLMLGVGLVYAAESLDKSFRKPEEIRDRLNLPVFGHVPAMQRVADSEINGDNLDSMLVTHYHARSPGTEAFRQLRTSLFFSVGDQSHEVIQVTSPGPGDGKSTVISNLAVCIAQSGKRVLLIDADLRKPRQHKVFGISSKVGLATVIADDTQLSHAIHPTAVHNLSLMPCGTIPDDPAELLTSPRFPELLSTFREQFDYVLVDTAPLLAVSDPAIVAPRVDGVLLTVRIVKNGRHQAERAKEILDGLDTKVLGVIVNGMDDSASSGYSYKNYDYSYAESYHSDHVPQGSKVRQRLSRILRQ